MSLIRLNDVSVRFDKVQVLREAFFKLEAGDRVGLIGRNGSGKSTLLKLVLDQVEPDSGTVSVELGTKIGYFSQFSELNGSSTIMRTWWRLRLNWQALTPRSQPVLPRRKWTN